MQWDLLIRGAKVFDGAGGPGRMLDVAVRDGRIAALGAAPVVKSLLLNPRMLPGFNDSGAHVTNMAYYDGNLRALRIALEDSEALFARMVMRLTREPAGFFGLDAGRIEVGARADIALFNPAALEAYDGDGNIRYIYRPSFECHQLVNRSDGVVNAVYVAGRQLWNGQGFTDTFGKERAGSALTVQ